MITDTNRLLTDDRARILAIREWDVRFNQTVDMADAERDRQFLRDLFANQFDASPAIAEMMKWPPPRRLP